MTRQKDHAYLWLVQDDIASFELVRVSHAQRRFALHSPDRYAIGIVEFGACTVRCKGRDERHGPGGVIVIPPRVLCTGEAAGPEGWSYSMIHVPACLLSAVGDRHTSAVPRFSGSFIPDRELYTRFGQLHRRLETAQSRSTNLSELHVFLRDLVLRHAITNAHLDTRQPSARVDRALRYLDQNYAVQVRLAALSRLLGLSKYSLIRIFKRELGISPRMYLGHVRIEQAKRMLRSGQPISMTAHSSGFSDQSHLTRHFKRAVGVTPGEYVRVYTQSAERGVPKAV